MRVNSKSLRTFTFAVGVMTMALIGTVLVVAQGNRPITWSPELHLKGTTDIPVQLQAPVLEGAKRVRLTNGTGSREVGTCQEYLNAVGTGFHPATLTDVKAAADFVYECFVLRDLQHARPATSSSSYSWSANSLTQLPPVLVPGGNGVTSAAEQSEKRGESWKQFDPNLKIKKIDGDLLLAEDNDFVYSLQILARGDFNGDGVEDIAVYGTAQGKHSTWAHAAYFIVSPSTNGKLARLTHGSAPYRLKAQIPN
jgi:hypothetical protein